MQPERFRVGRRNWRWGVDGWVRLPGTTPVAAFPTADEADAYRRRREADARRKVNPFDCGPVADLSSLPEPILRDWLLDAGIDPPPAGRDGLAPRPAWVAWWLTVRGKLTTEQFSRAWEGMDRLRFYAADEPADGPAVFAVTEVVWDAGEDWFVAEADGGRMVVAYQDRGRADREAAARTARVRGGAYPFAPDLFRPDAPRFDLRRPADLVDPFGNPVPDHLTPHGPLRDIENAPFFEVTAVPLDTESNPGARLFDPGPPVLGRFVYLAVRLDWRVTEDGCSRPDDADGAIGVPVRAFADREDAAAFCAAGDRAAKRELDPFRLTRQLRQLHPHDRGRLARRAINLGLTPPADGDWRALWEHGIAFKPDAVRDAAWDMFDAVRFYEPVPVLVGI